MSLYDQYVIEVQDPARQAEIGATGDSASQPVDLRFCIDIDYILTKLSLGLNFGTDSNDDFLDATLGHHLNSEAI